MYLDTDVEIVKPFEDLLENASLVTGFETKDSLITAFIACEQGEKHIVEFVDSYKERNFKISEGEYDLTTINSAFTRLMLKYGLKLDNSRQSLPGGVEIYPFDVFCGYDIENSVPVVTENTVTIHHFQMSWLKISFWKKVKYRIFVRFLMFVLGTERYNKLRKKIRNR